MPACEFAKKAQGAHIMDLASCLAMSGSCNGRASCHVNVIAAQPDAHKTVPYHSKTPAANTPKISDDP